MIVGRLIRPWYRDVGVWASTAYTLALLAFNLTNNTALGQVTGALVAGPLIAAILADRRRRVWFAGAFALLSAILSGWLNDLPLDAAQVWRFILIGVCTVIGVVGAGLRIKDQARLVTMEEVAKTAQLAIMAKQVPPILPRVQVGFRYLAASTESMIGGDAYEALQTQHGLRVLVADSMGKGTDAVRSAAITLGAFRELAHQEADLRDLLLKLNHSVTRDTVVSDYTTALIAQLNEETLTFVLAGHPPPLRIRKGETQRLEVQPTPPLSLIEPGQQPQVGSAVIRPGDSLLLFSDGLIEARDERGEFFPLEDRVEKLFADSSDDLETCIDDLIADLRQHVNGRLADDLVLVVLQLQD